MATENDNRARIIPHVYYTPNQAGPLTPWSPRTLRREIERGNLIAYAHNGAYKILGSDLLAWMESLKTGEK